jgi:osmotically-inducible protein OsmY
VDWNYQKLAAESAVSRLEGVTGVTNYLEIRPRAQPNDVKRKIVAALHRNAQLEANNIEVSVTGGKVRLDGKVKAWSERRLVEKAAWAAAGVTEVEDNLKVD